VALGIEEVIVPFRRSALRMKPSKVNVELSFGLIAPTPPVEHRLTSKYQMGCVPVMVMVSWVKTVPLSVLRGPESKPLIVELESEA